MPKPNGNTNEELEALGATFLKNSIREFVNKYTVTTKWELDGELYAVNTKYDKTADNLRIAMNLMNSMRAKYKKKSLYKAYKNIRIDSPEKVMELYLKGYPIEKISSELRITTGHVRLIIKEQQEKNINLKPFDIKEYADQLNDRLGRLETAYEKLNKRLYNLQNRNKEKEEQIT